MSLGQRWFAWLMRHQGPAHDRLVAGRKPALLNGLQGTVLEIGPGTGPNLRHYAPAIRWVGVEPNPHMHPDLRRAAAGLHRRIDLCSARAESLPFPDASMDAVVSTLVLCSVPDVPATLQEVRRVLRPGGCFVFIEHVAAPQRTALRRVQRLCQPGWSRLADGCHPCRDIAAALHSAHFAEVTIESFALPLPLVSPHIAGTALR